MNKHSCYAFYGSLRQGMYNHQIFEQHLHYLFTENLAGFRLYALERYPIAVKSESIRDVIKVEIFQVTDAETENKIHRLELNAGYYYDEVLVRGVLAGIYLFQKSGNHLLVPGGDWVQHVNKKWINKTK